MNSFSSPSLRGAKRRGNLVHLNLLLRWSALGGLMLGIWNFSAVAHVRTGAEMLLAERMKLIEGKKVGLICNNTSVLPNGTYLVDTLIRRGVNVTALFGPEHGIRGTSEAGASIQDGKDVRTGIPVYSLYGKITKPTPEMLANVDVLVFDIQDVGARFYTYISTMALGMQAAAENGKRFIVLDRPEPINGNDVEGPVLDTALHSFVGMFPIPIRTGMTMGELAKLIAGEHWMGKDRKIDLSVIKMEGWKRSMYFDETGLPWTPRSPNMKSLATATVYPGMCLFEGTNITEGRGTDKPFEYIGAPWIMKDTFAFRLNELRLKGVTFEPFQFTPQPDSVAAPKPKYKNQSCGGVYVHVTDRRVFRPVETALAMLTVVMQLFPVWFEFIPSQFDRLSGRKELREGILDGAGLKKLFGIQREGLKRFEEVRKKYLMY